MASPKLKIIEHRPSALERLVADYLAHQRSRGLSAHTAALTANVIEHTFLPWCRNERVTTPEQLTQSVLDRWATYLLTDHRTPAGKPLARESVRTYLRTLGSFVRWAQQLQSLTVAMLRTGHRIQTPQIVAGTKRTLVCWTHQLLTRSLTRQSSPAWTSPSCRG